MLPSFRDDQRLCLEDFVPAIDKRISACERSVTVCVCVELRCLPFEALAGAEIFLAAAGSGLEFARTLSSIGIDERILRRPVGALQGTGSAWLLLCLVSNACKDARRHTQPRHADSGRLAKRPEGSQEEPVASRRSTLLY